MRVVADPLPESGPEEQAGAPLAKKTRHSLKTGYASARMASAGRRAMACPAPKPVATILVVDDEPQNCRLLQALLRPEGYDVRIAGGGREALASIAERPPDLIMLDVTMPEMDGYKVAAILKSNAATSNIPIIMLTALIDRDARLSGLKSGAEEFLTKPVDRAELWLRVRNLLRLKAHGDFLADHGNILGRLVKSRTADLERFRAAMEISGDAIALVDRASLSYVDVNQTLCEMLGYARDQIIGNTVMGIFSADRETLERDYDALIADNECGANRVKGEYRRKDGTFVPVESRRRALLTDQGWVIVCNARDLTQSKAAEAQLHEVIELRTGRKRDEEALRLLAGAMDAFPDAIYLADRATLQFEHVNSAACSMQGRTREELMALGPAAMLSTQPEELGRVYDELIASGREDSVETLRQNPQGVPIWVERRRHAQRSANGWMIVTQVRDITARREVDARIAHLNRVYAVLSGITSLIVRAAERDELFREACRIAVEVGGFRMAWIGVLDEDTMTIAPVASLGMDADVLEAVQERFSLDGVASPATSVVARTIVDRTATVSNDLAQDPRTPFALRQASSGVHSMVILPLVVAGKAVGVLSLYSGEREFFHDDEMKLLTELADDIAFAIEHIERQERLDYLAYYDVLTGLANRSLFLERVAQYVRGAEDGGRGIAVCLVDVERFKNINDSLGQAAGDLLLKQVAAWLTAKTGDANLLARVSSDRFALVVPEVRQDGNIVHLVEKTIAAFMEHSFRLDESIFRIAAKVGIACYPADGNNADTLLKNAEAALKKAKARGERYLFYEQEMTLATAGKLTLENRLREALDKEEFVLHYQPKIDLVSGKLAGAEALIRWNDPRSGLVPPGQFIPILEETGLIYDVGRWALRRAIEDYLRWQAANLPAVPIAVNVSPLQLRNRGFVAEIERETGVHLYAAKGLELEITESLIMEDVKHSIASLRAIRALGVSVAIDDFGTGFSSLSYLSKLPVDTLKIDRSFVFDMVAGPEGLALVSTIINLAHSLKLKVVAEGVETEDQSHLLRLLGCDEMQGFLFSRPVPAEVFEATFLVPPELHSGLARQDNRGLG